MKRNPLIFSFLILGFITIACAGLSTPAEPAASPTAPLTQPQPVESPEINLPPLTEDQVPRIAVEEAKAALDSGAAILVDVRSVESYKDGHAAGSISIPLDNIELNVQNLSLKKDQWIIVYCT